MKADELKKKLAEHEDVMLIDVREQKEFEDSDQKVEGSANVPMGEMFIKDSKGELPKDKKIITICAKGSRCQIVAKELKEKGYDIDFLEGGVSEFNSEK